MAYLRHSEVRALLAAVRDVEAVGTVAAFPRRVLAAVERLVPGDVLSYNEVDLRARTNDGTVRPDDAVTQAQRETFNRLADQHPLIAHVARTGDRRALAISDFLSRDEYHRTEIYQGYYRAFPTEDMLSLTLPSCRTRVIGVAISRDRRNFTARDRLLLELLQPQLAHARASVQARTRAREMLRALEAGLEATCQGVVLLDPHCRIRQLTANARRWLAACSGHRPREGGRLPEQLDGWVHAQSRAGGRADLAPLWVQSGGVCLLARFVAQGEEGDQAMLLLQAAPAPAPPGEEPRPGPGQGAGPKPGHGAEPRLTPRETEVLSLLAAGESDREIAERLAISHRTVQKHVEHLYAKLGVHRRTLAALAHAAGATRVDTKR